MGAEPSVVIEVALRADVFAVYTYSWKCVVVSHLVVFSEDYN